MPKSRMPSLRMAASAPVASRSVRTSTNALGSIELITRRTSLSSAAAPGGPNVNDQWSELEETCGRCVRRVVQRVGAFGDRSVLAISDDPDDFGKGVTLGAPDALAKRRSPGNARARTPR